MQIKSGLGGIKASNVKLSCEHYGLPAWACKDLTSKSGAFFVC